jgi:Abnormal spindle-like microcephaly-assoc'd, ASPM-SPD-2-Hydin/PQQ-like domain
VHNLAQSATGRRRFTAITISAVALVAAVAFATGALPRTPTAVARADEVTASQNDLRDGWDPNEPGLSPAVVGSGSFGQLFSSPVNGQVYAQPVIAGSTLVVATENDHVYGLNSANGATKWSDSLGQPLPASAQGCGDLTPNTGITGTPVYDPSTGTVYLVAVENDGPSISQPDVYMYAINAQTGVVDWRVPIHGAPVNDPGRAFNPLTERQRAGLLLINGSVYVAFGSYCDYAPYVGYVAGVNTSSRAVTLWTDESGLTDRQGGIWQGGGGLMSDRSGRILVSTGNGVSPGPGPGGTPPAELGDAVVRLNVGSDGTLSAADFFSPSNAPTLDANDEDYGSGGPVGLPFGTSAYPHLLVQAGKDGRVFLLNRDSLGGREQGAAGTDADVSVTGPFGGQWGHPAAFGDTTTAGSGPSNDFVYYVGRNDYLRYLKLELNGSGTPVLQDAANSTATFGFTSGSPVVTSNGTDPSSAVVWEVYSSDVSGSGGMLEAFDAIPAGTCTANAQCMTPIWSTPIGTASKFTTPATSNGIVYVGTRDGMVLGFGSPDKAPLQGAPADFGQVAVGHTATQSVTVTASASVTISGIAASGSGLTAGSVRLPVNLTAGQSLTVPVTFAPTSPGGVTGGLAFTTNSANFPEVSLSITGDGTAPGFYANPASLSLGSQPDRTSASATVTIANGGTAAERVTATRPPAAPFSVTGLPTVGTVIQPGASVTAAVTYRPTGTGPDTGSFTVDGSTGNVTVNLKGTGVADVSQLTPTPAAISFGSVAMGQQATKTIQIANAGNLPATVTATAAPTIPFGAPDPIKAGLPLNPGYDLQVPITFTPSSTGAVTSRFNLTWTDALGTHTLSVPVSGTGTQPASGIAVSPPGGGWTLNGSAQIRGTSLVLTGAAQNEAGSAVYPVPVASNGLTASFTAQIGGGTGADGMTLSLLDASASGPGALGGAGGKLGFGGLHGIAIALDTYKNAGYPSSNFAGIATGVSGGELNFAATTTHVPNLRSGSHTVGVRVSGQHVTVSIDGTPVLSPTLLAGTVPPSVLVAFTGGTGGRDDIHTVTAATITTGGSALPQPGGGWTYNAAAGMSGADTVLTPAAKFQAGSVIYRIPVQTNGLQVQFDAQLSGGTGADGLTFALLNPTTATTAVGRIGNALGFGGLGGVAVALDTYQNPGYPSSNFAGIATGVSGGPLTYQSTVQEIPQLRAGTHTVMVQVRAGTGAAVILVWLDGELILTQSELSLGATALLAFTGGTGGLTDVHTIRDVAIAASG